MRTFECDFCHRDKPVTEIHGNGYWDEEHAIEYPDTLWWCTPCETGTSHSVREVVTFERNGKSILNFVQVFASDQKKGAKIGKDLLEELNPDKTYVMRACK